jgi:hypothetical protein
MLTANAADGYAPRYLALGRPEHSQRRVNGRSAGGVVDRTRVYSFATR